MLNSARNILQQITYKASCHWLKQDHINLEDELVDPKNIINSSENSINNDKIIMFILVAAVSGFIVFIVYEAKEQRRQIVIRRDNSSLQNPRKVASNHSPI